LVAVEVAGAGNSGSELAVVLHGGLRIEVKRGFDATTLRQLGQPIHAPALERSESELPLLVSESGPRTVIEQPQLF
jgi:hypothetical protein